MTDYFALIGEARRPWLDPKKLKERYHALTRSTSISAELNEAFRILSDPKLRLQHLLMLEGVQLSPGRPMPAAADDLLWKTATLLHEGEGWLQRRKESTNVLSSALLQPQRVKLQEKLKDAEEQLQSAYELEISRVQDLDSQWQAAQIKDLKSLTSLYESISYLTRLLQQTAEIRFQLVNA